MTNLFLKPVALTASATLNRYSHAGRTVLLQKADGITATLPAATGTGDEYDVMVDTTITSNSAVVKVGNATDTMVGTVTTASTTTGAGTHEAAGGTDDTITMNGTTTGGIAGSRVRCKDVKAGLWLIEGHLVGSGTLATPLSATVS
jgi:hypothetical protein